MNRFFLSLCASITFHIAVFGAAKYFNDTGFLIKPGVKQQNSLQEITVNIISDSSEISETEPVKNSEEKDRSSFTAVISKKELSFYVKTRIHDESENRIAEKTVPIKSSSSAVSALTRLADNLAHNMPPDYPYSARRFGHEGEVVLEIEITSEGRSGHVSVIKSSGYPSLDRAALKAAKKWIFFEGDSPFGESSITITQSIRFKLE